MAAIAYVQVAGRPFPIRETITFNHGYLNSEMAGRRLNAADFGARLINDAFGSPALRSALRRVPGGQFSTNGTDESAFRALRDRMTIDVNATADELVVGLDTPFPHQGEAAVHAVAEYVLKPSAIEAGVDSAGLRIDPTQVAGRTFATADVRPGGLSPYLVLPAATLIGIVGGFAIATYRQAFHRRIKFPAQLVREIGLPSAGYLPQISKKFSNAGRALAAFTEPNAEVAVQSRTTLLHLYRAENSHDGRTLLVTSPGVGEGRSTATMNLAVTLALMDEPVLVIDANLRAPVLHKLFGESEASLGLCEALDNPSAALDFVRRTHVDNLHYLTAGKLSSAAAAKLQGRPLSAVLSLLQKHYRHILFDGGALIGNPDTTVLAAKCDATLLVCHARRTSTRRAREAAMLLKRIGAVDIHAVVNELPSHLGRKYFNSPRPVVKSAQAASPTQAHEAIYEYGLTVS